MVLVLSNMSNQCLSFEEKVDANAILPVSYRSSTLCYWNQQVLGDGISVLQSLKSFTVSNQSLKSLWLVYGNGWSIDNTLCYIIRGWSICLWHVLYRLVQYSTQRVSTSKSSFFQKEESQSCQFLICAANTITNVMLVRCIVHAINNQLLTLADFNKLREYCICVNLCLKWETLIWHTW